MLNRFSNSQKDTMQIVAQDLKTDNINDVTRAIHTLKALCGNLEAEYLYAKLQTLEYELKSSNQNIDLIDSIILDIDEKLKKLIASIDENFKVYYSASKTEDEKLLGNIFNMKEVEGELLELSDLFNSLDSDALESTQKLVKKLSNQISKDKLDSMLEASMNFDFEDAQRYLQKIQAELKNERS